MLTGSGCFVKNSISLCNVWHCRPTRLLRICCGRKIVGWGENRDETGGDRAYWERGQKKWRRGGNGEIEKVSNNWRLTTLRQLVHVSLLSLYGGGNRVTIRPDCFRNTSRFWGENMWQIPRSPPGLRPGAHCGQPPPANENSWYRQSKNSLIFGCGFTVSLS